MNSENTTKSRSSTTINASSFPYIITITLILGIGLGFFITTLTKPTSATNITNTTASSTTNALNDDYVNSVYKIVQDKYLGDIPTKDALTYGAVKGLVNSLGNQYNSFLDPQEAKSYLDSRNPNIEGIGITLKYDGQYTEVETAIPGYPAAKAGLRPGDIITEVNGEKVVGLLPNAVATKIRGQSGTDVKIKVTRVTDTDTQDLDFNITRQKIQIDNITQEDLGDGIFKINIVQFLDQTADQFNSNWDNIVNEITTSGKPVKGIIVDLRNNPGGYVFSVRHVLEEFLKDGQTLLSEEEKNTNTTVYKDTRKGKFEDVPLVVLVNQGSASASEIFATSIQDNNRGKVIGMPTVGKGVEQQVITLDDQSLLVIVFQKWLTPSGRNISKDAPVKPDIQIDYTEDDYKKASDPQLDKAKEVLKSEM